MHHFNPVRILIYIFIIAVICKAQSWEFIEGPTGIYPNDEIILRDGRVLCSTYQGIFISDDYGDHWRVSIPSKVFYGVNSFTERLNGDILATYGSGVIKSEDRGENWSRIPINSYLGIYREKIKESPTDSALLFIRDSSLYKSTDGGYNWNKIWTGGLVDAFTVNDSGWIYLGIRYTYILISKDNGSSFTPLNIEYDFSYSIINQIYPDKHGGIYFSQDRYFYRISHFGNNKLTEIERDLSSTPLGISSEGDLIYKLYTCINLFDYSTKKSYMITCPFFVRDQFARNVVANDDTWIGNFGELGLFRSDDEGKTWKDINNGLGIKSNGAITVTRSGRIIVSAFNGGFWGSLYYSDDEGKTWSKKHVYDNAYFFDIDKLNKVGLIASSSYGIFTSDDEGIYWTSRMGDDIATYIFESKSGEIYTGTRSHGMKISRDKGLSWSSPENLSEEFFTSFGESATGRIFAGASYYGRGIYYSDDKGFNWSYTNPFDNAGVYDFITLGDSVYAGTQAGIYKSDNNGEYWRRLDYMYIKQFALAPNGELLGISTDGVIKSSDFGLHWETLGESLKQRKIQDLCFDNDNRLYAATDSGLYRINEYIYPFLISPAFGAENLGLSVDFEWTRVSSATGYEFQLSRDSLFNSVIKDISTDDNSRTVGSLSPGKTYYWRVKAMTSKFNTLYTSTGKFSTAPPFFLSQNYPNPFNDETIIEYYIPYTSKVKLKVYNILGELVENLVDKELTEGEYTYQWNASDLPSGIYFLQMEWDNFSKVKKAILLK